MGKQPKIKTTGKRKALKMFGGIDELRICFPGLLALDLLICLSSNHINGRSESIYWGYDL